MNEINFRRIIDASAQTLLSLCEREQKTKEFDSQIKKQ